MKQNKTTQEPPASAQSKLSVRNGVRAWGNAIPITLIVIFAAWMVLSAMHGQSAADRQKQLAAALPELKVPDQCKAEEPVYNPSEFGSVAASEYTVKYRCTTTYGAAYDSITGTMHVHGYEIEEDGLIPYDAADPYYRPGFALNNGNYYIDYEFDPHYTGDNASKDSVRAAPVSAINVTVSSAR